MPLANAFPRSPAEFAGEESFPLDLSFCQGCALVQTLDVIDPELLFRDYIYVTGTSDTMAAHNRAYAANVVERLELGSDALVIELASNDGSLLRCFQEHGVRTLGVEPAINIAEKARVSGIETLDVFFDSAMAVEIRRSHGPARAVVANNVFAHVDEPVDFLEGCKTLLDERVQVVIEVPYLSELLDRLEYDTVYHEHLCYFSVRALLRICDAVGLSLLRVDHVPVHGGSLRASAGLPAAWGGHGKSVLERCREEERLGLADFERFARFAADVEVNRRALRELLASLRGDGHSIAAYGALSSMPERPSRFTLETAATVTKINRKVATRGK